MSIIPYNSIEVFLLSWGIIWLPLYLRKHGKMRELYWQIQNQHSFKPHGINHATLWFSMSSFFSSWRCIEAPKSTTQKRAKKDKKMLTVTPTNLRCTIGTKIKTKAVHVTSLAKCLRRYGVNKKTRILVWTFLEVEIGPILGRLSTFVVARFDLGGVYMKVAKIKIRSVKLHTSEPPYLHSLKIGRECR